MTKRISSMDEISNLQNTKILHAGIAFSNEEFLVIGVVVFILFAFEMGPKFLNYMKNKKSKP
jgi:hypothetical protein